MNLKEFKEQLRRLSKKAVAIKATAFCAILLKMNILDLLKLNRKILYTLNEVVDSTRVQNFDIAPRRLNEASFDITRFVENINLLFEIISVEEYQGRIIECLTGIVEAQTNNDFILVADLVELQLIPCLLELQSVMVGFDEIYCFDIYWDANLEVMRGCKKYIELAELLENNKQKWLSNGDTKFQLEPTSYGEFTLKINDNNGTSYYLHSNTSAYLEACKLANRHYDVCENIYTVYGFGLGYLPISFNEVAPESQINVYEPNLDIIMYACMSNDLTALLSNEKVSLVYDPEYRELSKQFDGDYGVFVMHYPSLRLIKEDGIREKFNQLFIKDSGARNNYALFKTNLDVNVKLADGYVSDIKKCVEGKKVVIIAAGPSLDKNLSELKDYCDKKHDDIVVFAVETVIKKLFALGITPDYYVVSDASDRIVWHLGTEEMHSCPLLYLSTASRYFVRKYTGKKYLVCQNGLNISEEYAKENGLMTFESGGSVATISMDIATRLGAKSVAFIGLDMAYTGNLAHTTGSARRVANDIDDMQDIPGYELIKNENGYEIKDVMVKSPQSFGLFRNWFERRLKGGDISVTVYDATEGGAVINGMKIVTLSEYLSM